MNHYKTQLAQKSLKGISIGDAFGESFFGETDRILGFIHKREIPETSWEFTDDTLMSIAVFEQLKKHGDIQQDELIQTLVRYHNLDPMRGYGATARRMLREIDEGGDWREIVAAPFEGMGSMGNGAAMRSAPIGAYCYDDLEKVVQLSKSAAQVTHTHLEGVSGAITVAVATALATISGIGKEHLNPNDFITKVLEYVPESTINSRLRRALNLNINTHTETLKKLLGNGSQIMAQDTVPFCIWCAAHHLDNFEKALWKAVSVLGDRDTICAIVGGIVIMFCDEKTVPSNWLIQVEDFENSIFKGL